MTETMPQKDWSDFAEGEPDKNGWLPIESATSDETPKLAWGIWQGEIHGITDTPWYGIITTAAKRTDYDRDGTGWWNLEGGDAYATWMKPTHYQLLPAPPEPSNE